MEENRELSDPIALLIKVQDKKKGSGFFVSRDLIATNIHVVAKGTSVSAELVGANAVYTVEEVVAFDARNDLVINKVIDDRTYAFRLKVPLIRGIEGVYRIKITAFASKCPIFAQFA